MNQSGATLLELMLVLAISAILLTIGIPSFVSASANSSVTSATNAMVASLHLARSEAIKRGSRAVVCPSPNGAACAGSGGWEQGWVVFNDANNNAALDTGEAVILTQGSMPPGYRMTGQLSSSSYISYTPSGAAKKTSGAFQAGHLTVCEALDSTVSARQIIISKTGRPRTARVTLAACPS